MVDSLRIARAAWAFNAIDDTLLRANLSDDLYKLKPGIVSIEGEFDWTKPRSEFTVTEELDDFYRVTTIEVWTDPNFGIQWEIKKDSKSIIYEDFTWPQSNSSTSDDAMALAGSPILEKFNFDPYKNYFIRYYFTQNHNIGDDARSDDLLENVHYIQDDLMAFLNGSKNNIDHAYISAFVKNVDLTQVAWGEWYIVKRLLRQAEIKIRQNSSQSSNDIYIPKYRESFDILSEYLRNLASAEFCLSTSSFERSILTGRALPVSRDYCEGFERESTRATDANRGITSVTHPIWGIGHVTDFLFDEPASTMPPSPIDPEAPKSIPEAVTREAVDTVVTYLPVSLEKHPDTIAALIRLGGDWAENDQIVNAIGSTLEKWTTVILEQGLGSAPEAIKQYLLSHQEEIIAQIKEQIPQQFEALRPLLQPILEAMTADIIRAAGSKEAVAALDEVAPVLMQHGVLASGDPRVVAAYQRVAPKYITATLEIVKDLPNDTEFKKLFGEAALSMMGFTTQALTTLKDDPTFKAQLDLLNAAAINLVIGALNQPGTREAFLQLVGVEGVKLTTDALTLDTPSAQQARQALVDAAIITAQAYKDKVMEVIMQDENVAQIQGLLEQLMELMDKVDAYVTEKMNIRPAKPPAQGPFRDETEALMSTVITDPARWKADGNTFQLNGFARTPNDTASEVTVYQLDESNDMLREKLVTEGKSGEIGAKLVTHDFTKEEFLRALTDYPLHEARTYYVATGNGGQSVDQIFVAIEKDPKHRDAIYDMDGNELIAERTDTTEQSFPFNDGLYTLKRKDTGEVVATGVQKMRAGLTGVCLDNRLLEGSGYANPLNPTYRDEATGNPISTPGQFDVYQYLDMGMGVFTSEAISLKPVIEGNTAYLPWTIATDNYKEQHDKSEDEHKHSYDLKVDAGDWAFNEDTGEMWYVVLASGINVAYKFAPDKVAQNVADGRDFVIWHKAMREQYPALLEAIRRAAAKLDEIKHE
ncbi:hypothetical protein K1X76_10290 [bacterium]|nr:hypothetical protein [bacterium]